MGKSVKKIKPSKSKTTVKAPNSTDSLYPAWMFDKIDINGQFAFNINGANFKHSYFMDKMINYSKMTWAEIKRQTHDDGKSKHHYLTFSSLSSDAKARFEQQYEEEYQDAIFSFAFDNLLRIIGIKENEKFHVIWYDEKHQVCLSKQKHS